MGLTKMFDDMLDIGSQMVQKWDRQGPEHEIDCADDFTRLAFDTIAMCAFNYRYVLGSTFGRHLFITPSDPPLTVGPLI